MLGGVAALCCAALSQAVRGRCGRHRTNAAAYAMENLLLPGADADSH